MRILIIAFHFPPDTEVGAIRPGEFARLLPAHGMETWVLSVEGGLAGQNRDDISVSDSACERVLRASVGTTVSSRLLSFALCLKRALHIPSSINGESIMPANDGTPGTIDVSSKAHRVVGWLSYPDEYAGWYRSALKCAIRQHHKTPFDVILSTSPPRVAHLIGHQLAMRYSLPWIMDMRDPWTMDWAPGLSDKRLKARYEALFLLCGNRADRIVTVTETLRQKLIRRHPALADKIVTIPNGSTPRVATESTTNTSPSLFSIGYYGNLFGVRSCTIFFEGLKLWLDANPRERARIRVRFFGYEFGDAAGQCTGAGLDDVVEFHQGVTRNEVFRLMRDDYGLLLIANNQPLQVPAKLFDYLNSGRRILALTEPDSATAQAVRTIPGVATAQSPQELKAALDRFLGEFNRGENAELDRAEILKEVSYERRAARIAEIIADVRGLQTT